MPNTEITKRHSALRTSLALILALPAPLACSAGSLGGADEASVSSIEQAVTGTSSVVVNQLGYLTGQTKVAVGIGACGGAAFQLKNSSGTVVYSGTASAAMTDPGSGDSICKADFTAYTTAGTGFTITIGSLGTSDAFPIQTTDRYGNLYVDAMKYFQYHRLGSATVNLSLTGAKGGTVARSWALRPTTALSAYGGWTSGTFNIDGGHADAGDFGMYPDNTAQAMWILMNLKELRNPDNAVYDLVGEIDYGVKYLMGVLPADTTKQASHKCHDDSWGSQAWGGYPAGNDASATVRHCMGPSITATYAVARSLAQAARVVTNATTATSYWNKAVEAWNRANLATTPVYNPATASPGAGIGGGDYPDAVASDDLFDAAVEMYLTAKKRGLSYTTYLNAVTTSPHYKTIARTFDWGETGEGTQGNLSLWAYNKKIGSLGTEIDTAGIQTALVTEADAILSTIGANGYPTPISGTNYSWGSNKTVVDSIIILGHAREATGDKKYTRAAMQAMDYLMGVNTLRLSFITGYGTYFEKATHDRQANGNSPIGWLAGGPLGASLVNDSFTPKTATPAKNYYVSDLNWDGAWCSKENTIDWNAPLAWAAWFARSSVTDLTGCTVAADCNDGNPCSVDACTAGTCTYTAGAAGTVCRAAGTSAACDPAETCTGTSTSCPANAFGASGTVCDDGNASTTGDVCNGTGTCAGTIPSAPYGGTARAITSTIQAEDFDTGGEGSGYHDTDVANSGAAYRTTEGVDIEATTDTNAGYDVGWTAAGEYMKYTVNVATTGTYSLDVRLAATAAGNTMHVEVDGVNKSGSIAIPNTGGWQTWQTVNIPNISLTAGNNRIVKVVFDTGGVNFNWFKFNTSGGCTTAADCNDNNPCTVDACNTGTCSYTAGNAGTVCRAANGACDVAETCTGTATACPADGFASSATQCRAAGSNATCDPAESCTGTSASCPANAYAANGTACNDGNASTTNDVCNGSGTCAGTASGGTTPCAGLCSPIQTMTTTGSITVGANQAYCQEWTTLNGGNCGNMTGSGDTKTLSINGTAMTCNWANWASLPAKRNGGYCVQVTAGTSTSAGYTTW